LALGQENKALGYCSTVFGYKSSAEGIHSFAKGDGAVARGDFSYANGWGAFARGNYAFAHGHQVDALAPYSVAFGKGTLAGASGSFVFGDRCSTSMDNDSTVNGWNALSGGSENIASHSSSFALGRKLFTYNANGGVIGQYNAAIANPDNIWSKRTLLVAGNGTDENTRSNAHIWYMNGDAFHSGALNATALNAGTIAISTRGSIGDGASATHSNSFAAGRAVTTTGTNMTVVGQYNNTASSAVYFRDTTSKVLFAVGNGYDATHRYNALTVCQRGDVRCAGNLFSKGLVTQSFGTVTDMNNVKNPQVG
jgi:hypothetical protein